jgi:hypothetical protein
VGFILISYIMVHPKNLSWMENTPELPQAIRLGQNKGRWEWYFYTTLGHIVTKILDMDITFHLPDGSEYKPFTTVWEVNTFFRITPDQYWVTPNPSVMDHFVSEIYRQKLRPREQEVLNPQRDTMRDFFEVNIWRDVDDSDTVDTLLWKIDELAEMWIEEVSQDACNDLKEWIIMNCIWTQKTLDDWNRLSQQERSEHLVEYLNKEKYTEYFVDIVVDLPWRRHPSNPYKYMMDNVQHRIRALYRVDWNFEKILWRVSQSQFRNTRYL